MPAALNCTTFVLTAWGRSFHDALHIAIDSWTSSYTKTKQIQKAVSFNTCKVSRCCFLTLQISTIYNVYAQIKWKRCWLQVQIIYNVSMCTVSKQIQDVDSMLVKRWSSVVDGGLTFNQHWFTVLCLLGLLFYKRMNCMQTIVQYTIGL